MIRAETITQSLDGAVDTITLDEGQRHRRRIVMTSDGGIRFLLDLVEARLLTKGDGIVLEDGRVIAVIPAPEALYRVEGRDPRHLLSLAWQIGNRHLAAQLMADHILIREDSVIRDMLLGLGATVTPVQAAFDPEGGAYGDVRGAHHHAHPDNHDHSHGHSHGHVHAVGQAKP